MDDLCSSDDPAVLILPKFKFYSLDSKSAIIGILQVFGEKAFEKFGKGLISIHFSDNHPGIHKKVLLFKFVLPSAKNMADMTRLVALVPYYIDLIGRYKLSSQVGEFAQSYYQLYFWLVFYEHLMLGP